MARPPAARTLIARVVVLAALTGCAAARPVEVSTASRTPDTAPQGTTSYSPPAEPTTAPSTAATTTTTEERFEAASRRRPPTTTTTTRSQPATTTTTTAPMPTTPSTRPEPATTTTTTTTAPPAAGDAAVVDMAVTPDGTGAWLLSSDGTVRAVGTASHVGDRSGRLTAPAVEIASTRSGGGYFITTAVGQVFVFGDAVHAGDVPARDLPPGSRVTGMVPDPDGYGYWMVTNDGYFMTFEENFYAPSPGPPNPRTTPVVAVATDPTRSGWGNQTGWHAVTAGGEILWYGSWAAYGQPDPAKVTAPIVDIAATPTGRGYALVDAAGHVEPFGDATFHGDAHPAAPVVSIAITPTNQGYWITTADGTIVPFGDATNLAG